MTRTQLVSLMAAIIQSSWSGNGGRDAGETVDEVEELLTEIDRRAAAAPQEKEKP